MHNLLPYLVARSNAAAMDRRGPPSAFMVRLVMVPAMIVAVGFAALFAVALVSIAGWLLLGI